MGVVGGGGGCVKTCAKVLLLLGVGESTGACGGDSGGFGTLLVSVCGCRDVACACRVGES